MVLVHLAGHDPARVSETAGCVRGRTEIARSTIAATHNPAYNVGLGRQATFAGTSDLCKFHVQADKGQSCLMIPIMYLMPQRYAEALDEVC